MDIGYYRNLKSLELLSKLNFSKLNVFIDNIES